MVAAVVLCGRNILIKCYLQQVPGVESRRIFAKGCNLATAAARPAGSPHKTGSADKHLCLPSRVGCFNRRAFEPKVESESESECESPGATPSCWRARQSAMNYMIKSGIIFL